VLSAAKVLFMAMNGAKGHPALKSSDVFFFSKIIYICQIKNRPILL